MNTLAVVLVVSGAALIYWALKPGAPRVSGTSSASLPMPSTQASTGRSGIIAGAAGEGAGGGGGGSY